ncbi:hypothetical protein BD560DRAFT_452398 [Blakeslea trispora]|nr:hypothetical protein BD560DRAFT_452398 [Blakeslea trispora]
MALNVTISLLQGRFSALRAIDFQNTSELKPWQKYALMYRKGQEDVFESAIQKIEEMKRLLIQRMRQDQEEKSIAPVAPFITILNPSHPFSSIDINLDDSFYTLDQVVITVQSILKKNPALEQIVKDNFDEMESEKDIIMMLGLIKENAKSDSQYREFFDKATERAIRDKDLEEIEDDVLEELQEMYESMVPAFAEAYPSEFDLGMYSIEAFVWADYIISNYSLSGNLFAIVPF